MRGLASAFLVLAFMANLLSGSTWGLGVQTGEPATLLVGYAPEDKRLAHLAIEAAGGSVRRSSAELGFAVVDTNDRATFTRVAGASPFIQYVENDDATRLAGSQWNGAQWNGAQWNGAQWNGAQWNGAQWNGAQWNGAKWNGAQWNGAQWNAARWTIEHFRASHGTHWRADLDTIDPGLVWQWGSWAIEAPAAWQITTGTRATDLCVLDSGVAWDHPDLAPNLWTGPLGEHGWNAIDPTASAYDDAGHGTHIAGIAAAAVGNGYGIAGVGNARIMAVKVLDGAGHGLESDLAFGLAWCALHGADVAVMALSATEPGPTLDRALQFAADRDVLLLASAGNDGPCDACVAFPANDPRVVAVGALDGGLQPAWFSNRGAELEVMAPGVDILGPFPGDVFVFGSGTSQAVAYAAGLATLVRDANPALSAADARSLLQETARDLAESGKDDLTGHGLLRADVAVSSIVGA